MSCYSVRVINNESYYQDFRYRDCDGYVYIQSLPPGWNRVYEASEIIEYGTLEIENLTEETPQEQVISGIRYFNSVNWGEVYEASLWHNKRATVTNDFGIIYTVEQNSDAWQYQLTDFDVENSNWDEL